MHPVCSWYPVMDVQLESLNTCLQQSGGLLNIADFDTEEGPGGRAGLCPAGSICAGRQCDCHSAAGDALYCTRDVLTHVQKECSVCTSCVKLLQCSTLVSCKPAIMTCYVSKFLPDFAM